MDATRDPHDPEGHEPVGQDADEGVVEPDDDRPDDMKATETRFARLFEDHRDRFMRIAHIWNRRPGGDASLETVDYVQDASFEFLKKPREVKSESHFVQLFKGFLKNSFRGKRRDARAQKRGGGKAPVELPETMGIPNHGAGPGTLVGQQESEDMLLGRLAELEEIDRQLITLRLWDEQSWEDLARRFDLASPDAARKRYTRALKRLEKELDDDATASQTP